MIDSSKKTQWLDRVASSDLPKFLFIMLTILTLITIGYIIWPLKGFAPEFSWLIFYPAVIVAALYAGFFAGLLTTVLACLAIMFLWPLLVYGPDIDNSFELLKMAVFVITCSVISYYIAAMQRIKKALQQAELGALASSQAGQFMKSIIDSTPDMMGYWDKDLYCRYANNAYSDWFGMQPKDIIGMSFQQLAGEKLYKLNEPYIHKVLAGESQRFERTLTKANGSVGHIIGHYIPDFAPDGSVKGFSIQSNEVTLLKETEAKLKLAACVFDSTLDGVLITDGKGVILSVNPSFSEITGYTAEDAVGKTVSTLHSNQQDEQLELAMLKQLTTAGRWQGEIWNRRKNGELYLQRTNISMLRDDNGELLRYVSVFSDITELRRKDDHIKHLAFHDALTNLPNRTLLLDRINQKLINTNRDQCSLALMFLDLDGFKQVNDKFGHKVGDTLLKEMAQRLLGLVRQSDTVARVGGDEFIFILNKPQGQLDISDVGNRIISAINQPIDIFGQNFQIGVSIGIALFPDHGETANDLINNADRAMYEAKSSGRNKLKFYLADS